jgi:hypothetical protein
VYPILGTARAYDSGASSTGRTICMYDHVRIDARDFVGNSMARDADIVIVYTLASGTITPYRCQEFSTSFVVTSDHSSFRDPSRTEKVRLA